MEIFNRKIGLNSPTYFIAEIGSNFDGDLNRAKELIRLAANSGADAVKFQHYTSKTLVSDIGFSNLGKLKTHQSKWKKKVSETYDQAALNKDWTEELSRFAHENKLGFLTSPYSKDLVDYVEDHVDAYKIGSGDITYNEILKKISKKNKPIFLATGASSMQDIFAAMEILSKSKNEICLMQCNTNYTSEIENYKFQNLNVLKKFKDNFPKTTLGLSCHLKTWISVIASVAIGARVIEKHFTDNRNRKGPDHKFATTPKEWMKMVHEVRNLESMLGSGEKIVEENEKSALIVQQRSIISKSNLEKGEIVKKTDLDILRPCPNGAIKPFDIDKIIGKPLLKAIKIGDHFMQKHFKI